MRALIVYESMFGDAQRIAQAVAAGLSAYMQVDIVEVGAAPAVLADDLDLLVVGGPTHMLNLSKPASRREAAKRAGHPVVSSERGLREWLDSVQGGSRELAAAVFTTRLAHPWWLRFLGSAGQASAKRLRRLGYRLVAPVESFYVTRDVGPLVTGEQERARRWGEQLGVARSAPHGVHVLAPR
jgi:hypothetical protein